jgi:hypothetical protein
VNRCSGCGYDMPRAWAECRKCGAPVPATAPAGTSLAETLSALASAPPPPPVPLPGTRPAIEPRSRVDTGYGAPDDALLPGAAPRDIGPDTLLPREQLVRDPVISIAPPARASRSGVEARTFVIGAIVVACIVGAAFSLFRHGSNHQPPAPTILAPLSPSAGIPTSLSAIVRIAAESARHTALSAVISTAGPGGGPVTVAQLASEQPAYQWVAATTPSTTNTIISVASVAGADQIAVSGTNREICAFARWSPAAGASYVTMDHVTTCDADTAPTTGWSSLAGGSAQDLPDENGN